MTWKRTGNAIDENIYLSADSISILVCICISICILDVQSVESAETAMDFWEVWTTAVFVFQCFFVFLSVFQCVFVFQSVFQMCRMCRNCNGFSGGVDSRGAWETDDEHEQFPVAKGRATFFSAYLYSFL